MGAVQVNGHDGWLSIGNPMASSSLSHAIVGKWDLETHLRQSLLVTETAATRLSDLIPLLKQGNLDLRERIAKQNPFQGPRLN